MCEWIDMDDLLHRNEGCQPTIYFYNLVTIVSIAVFVWLLEHFIALCQWFSTRNDFVPRGTFGKVWKHFLLVMTGRPLLASSGWAVAKYAAPYPTVHRTAPTMKNRSAQNVNSAIFPLSCWVSFTVKNCNCLCKPV